MGILDRVSRLLRANVNDTLDRAEDPEKMLDELLREMEGEIRQARTQVASMIAQEKELAADKAEADRVAADWQRRAELAVDQGRDDLAREALRRKRDGEENARVYAEQLAAQQQSVSRLKSQLQELENKYEQSRAKRDALIARSRRARAQQEVNQSLSDIPASGAASEFERFERRVRGSEARSAATEELASVGLDDDFAALERDHGIDTELEALKSSRSSGASSGHDADDDLAQLKASRTPAANAGGTGAPTAAETSDWSPTTPGSPSSGQ